MHMRYKYAFSVKKKKQHIPSDETSGYAIDNRDVAGVVTVAGRYGARRRINV